MLSYDDLVAELEDAWIAAGLHDHGLIEQVIPSSHDRSFKAELFPEHGEPLTFENMPPWAELTFLWSAVHQLRAEGRELPAEPLELSWMYMVNVQNMAERNDIELVHMFQRAVQSAFQRYFPREAEELSPVAVEVRRAYQNDGPRVHQAYLQLVCHNLTDLTEQWEDLDLTMLRSLVRVELQLTAAVIANLADVFAPTGRGGYRTVDAA